MRIFSHQTEVEKDQTSVKNITRYAPDYREGLTDEQVAERVHAQATNETIDPSFKTNKQIVLQNIFTYFNLIFIVLAVLLCLVSSYKNLTFLPVILANTGIAIYQEIRSKKILDNLSVLNAAKVTVVRNGAANKIDMEELVLDDVILLETGQQIPADGYVLDGKLQVNEALLTGEADEIVKEVDDYLMSGSFVVSGKAYVRLDKVGYDSYISQLTAKAKKWEEANNQK